MKLFYGNDGYSELSDIKQNIEKLLEKYYEFKYDSSKHSVEIVIKDFIKELNNLY